MTPKVLSLFFQLNRPLNCGSVELGRSEYTPPNDPSAVVCLANSSGLRVMMSTEPEAPPSWILASEVLCTTTSLTISAGSRL